MGQPYFNWLEVRLSAVKVRGHLHLVILRRMHQDDGARSSIKMFANIFISFIGAGILGMPHAFKEVGI